MKRFLLATSAMIAMSAASFAADLPARVSAVAPAPMYAVPMFTWSGFYVGLNAGAAFGGGNRDRLRAETLSGANQDEINFANRVNSEIDLAGYGNRRHGNDSGFTGGAQIGYNWQWGALVAGIEADVNYRGGQDKNDDFSIAWQSNRGGRALDYHSGRGGSDWFVTLRPRIGVAMDRTLLYVTGGLAYAGGSSRGGSVDLYDTDTNPDTLIATWDHHSRRSRSNWGWTLGAGVEHAFSNNWTVKLEYLYVDLDRGGRRDLTTTFVPRERVVFTGGRHEDNFHVVRVGLNYKFGGSSAGAPVLARY